MRRLFDILVSAAALIVTSPILLAGAIAIVLESPGSPVFKQRRVGKDGVDFNLFKLRTMVKNAEQKGAGLVVEAGDSRILRCGNLLRRLSIDELPNLINVLKGDMSIIGPRPTVRAQVEKYDEHQRRRLAVKPGITGWAQVRYAYGASLHDATEKLQYDLYYVKNHSLFLDIMILIDTVQVVLLGKGAR